MGGRYVEEGLYFLFLCLAFLAYTIVYAFIK
jgi:hypothetical protein